MLLADIDANFTALYNAVHPPIIYTAYWVMRKMASQLTLGEKWGCGLDTILSLGYCVEFSAEFSFLPPASRWISYIKLSTGVNLFMNLCA